MAFNIFSTLNQNLQNFWGDAYDAYQAWKSKVGNVASTINTNLQNFWGDIYDVGSTIKKNVSDFGTSTYNQGKNVASTIKKNVWDYATGQINEIKAIPSQISSGIDTLQKGARDLNYQAWNAGMKALTGKNNATFSDLAPNLWEEMSRNTGKADEEKVKAFVNEIMKGGYNQEQALQILDSTLAQQPDYFNKQTYGDKIRKTAVNRGREFGKTYQDFSTGKIGFGEATLRNAGDLVGLGGGVIGDTITQIPWVTPTLNAIGGAITSIPWVKPWMEAYGEFAKNNPRFAENAQAVANLGLTALGSTEGQALMKQSTKAVGRGIKKAVTPLVPYIDKGTNAVKTSIGNAMKSTKSGVGNIAESVTANVTGLERWTIATAKNQSALFKEARLGNLNRETVTGQAVDAIQKRLDDLSEIGKGYDSVRVGNVVANSDDVAGVYLKNAWNVATKQLTKADKSTLQDLSDYISDYKGNVTDADLLALRRQVDSVLYDPNTGMPRKITPQAKNIVNGVRADIDAMAKSRIKWLAEIDAQYAPEVAILKKVKKDIFNADGTLKDNAISTISNITGKGKEAKLARLEEIMPWIGDKVSAIKAYEDVLNASGNKVGNYARAGIAWTAAATINPWLLAWWVATHPKVVSFLLEKYGLAKNDIASYLAKKSFTPADTKIFQEALKKVPKEEVNKFILKAKLPPILPYNTSDQWIKKK